jgi:hypothetical protein
MVSAEGRPHDQEPPAVPALRPDVAEALQQVRGALVGSMKEANLLGGYLGLKEWMLALTGAHGEGPGSPPPITACSSSSAWCASSSCR